MHPFKYDVQLLFIHILVAMLGLEIAVGIFLSSLFLAREAHAVLTGEKEKKEEACCSLRLTSYSGSASASCCLFLTTEDSHVSTFLKLKGENVLFFVQMPMAREAVNRAFL